MTRSHRLPPDLPRQVEQSPLYLKWVEGARERGAEMRRQEMEATGAMAPGELTRLVLGQEGMKPGELARLVLAQEQREVAVTDLTVKDLIESAKTDAQRAFEAFHIHLKWSEAEKSERDAWQAVVVRVKEWPDYERGPAVAREAFYLKKHGGPPKLGWDAIPESVQEWWRTAVKVIREDAQSLASIAGWSEERAERAALNGSKCFVVMLRDEFFFWLRGPATRKLPIRLEFLDTKKQSAWQETAAYPASIDIKDKTTGELAVALRKRWMGVLSDKKGEIEEWNGDIPAAWYQAAVLMENAWREGRVKLDENGWPRYYEDQTLAAGAFRERAPDNNTSANWDATGATDKRSWQRVVDRLLTWLDRHETDDHNLPKLARAAYLQGHGGSVDSWDACGQKTRAAWSRVALYVIEGLRAGKR